jgi:hypothetical protein
MLIYFHFAICRFAAIIAAAADAAVFAVDAIIAVADAADDMLLQCERRRGRRVAWKAPCMWQQRAQRKSVAM